MNHGRIAVKALPAILLGVLMFSPVLPAQQFNIAGNAPLPPPEKFLEVPPSLSEAEARKWLSGSDVRQAKIAAEFFASRGAVSVLLQAAEDGSTEDTPIYSPKDIQVYSLRKLRLMDRAKLQEISGPLIVFLKKQPPFVSGSESATIHRIFMNDLIDLIAYIKQVDVPSDFNTQKRIENLLGQMGK